MVEYANLVKRELQDIPGVRRVDIYGDRKPCINIDIIQDKMANLGVHPAEILATLNNQNKTVYSGYFKTGKSRLRIGVDDSYESIRDIENLLIQGHENDQLRLRDVASVTRGYQDPSRNEMRYDTVRALGISISMEKGGNIVTLGEKVDARLEQLKSSRIPVGIDFQKVFFQPDRVREAIGTFMINLVESVLVVILVLMLTMRFRSGVIIGTGLVIIVLGAFVILYLLDGTLQRVSLAALIVAMGMLVDNAIVVSDSALVNMQRGMRKRVAIMRACSSTALPLLAATIIAILTFLPIYYSPHITGELLSSLVVVIGVSLMFSWVFALTQTPFFIQEFVRRPRPDELKDALFAGKYYDKFRAALRWVICHRYATIGCMVVMMLLAAWSFKFIPKVFMPALDKQYFTLDVWLPEGTKIEETDRQIMEMSEYIRGQEETEIVSTYIGRTPPRYYLSNVSFGPQSNYAQILVKCKTSELSRQLHTRLQDSISLKYPEPLIKVNKFELSPLTEAVIEARFLGPDPS